MAKHPFDWETWVRLDATELAKSISAGDTNASEVVTQFADAAAIQSKTLNAVVEIFDEAITYPGINRRKSQRAFLWGPRIDKRYGFANRG